MPGEHFLCSRGWQYGSRTSHGRDSQRGQFTGKARSLLILLRLVLGTIPHQNGVAGHSLDPDRRRPQTTTWSDEEYSLPRRHLLRISEYQCPAFGRRTEPVRTHLCSPSTLISLSPFGRNMAILNEQSKMSIEVTLCVPENATGAVRWVGEERWTELFRRSFRLLDPQTEVEIISYRVSQILFCARGPSNTPLACCWAFTTSRLSTTVQQDGSNNSQELLYQCQVFRCDLQEAVSESLPSPLGSSFDRFCLDLPHFAQLFQCLSSND